MKGKKLVLLKEEDVPRGATVVLCLKDKTVPEVDENGNQLVLKVLRCISGKKRFFPTDGFVEHKSTDGKKIGAITATGLAGFRENVRFAVL